MLQRFRDLALTPRSWLVVAHPAPAPAPAPSLRPGRHFPTLADAVAASRPGDTIILEPGAPHAADGVVTPHPLRILGGGDWPEAAILRSASFSCAGAPHQPALLVAATARLAGVTVEGGMAGCVAHLRGRLVIEGCVLRCEARGLRHLAAPLVALASDGGLPTQPSICVEVVPGGVEKEEEEEEEGGRAAVCVAASAVPSTGPGVLSVVECSMEGGATAVSLGGTGALQAVRVIYELRKSLFWFDVDSSEPGWRQQQQPAAAAAVAAAGVSSGLAAQKPFSAELRQRLVDAAGRRGGEECSWMGDGEAAGVEVEDEEPPCPRWLTRGRVVGFDPAALQAHVAAVLAASSGGPSCGDAGYYQI